jgi:transcriptional regulator with XRE-family HTH domain
VSRPHDEGLNGSVAAVLREARTSAGYTIEQLAERSGIPVVTVQRLLAARRAITMAAFDSLCFGLGVSPGDVMTVALTRDHADRDLVARVLAGIKPTRKNGAKARPASA